MAPIKQPNQLLALQRELRYQFTDLSLLQTALHHRSAKGDSNERFEFLGDAILSLIIAELLFQRFPTANEGELSRMRAHLVCGETLAKVARILMLGDYLIMGSGELKTGGFQRSSILADALEAIIGAIYLDSQSIVTCQQCILIWFESSGLAIGDTAVAKDAKTELQEYLQAHKLPLPVYQVVKIEGAAHEQRFYVSCEVEGLSHQTLADESSRRKAEQLAAMRFLELLYDR